MELIIFTDGGARGNPGPAAAGVVVFCGKEIICQAGVYLGRKTNNEAEYLAVKLALDLVEKYWRANLTAVNFYLDSQLVVSQLEGRYKIKAGNLQRLAIDIKKQLRGLECPVRFFHHPREKNKLADSLVNLSLDCQN